MKTEKVKFYIERNSFGIQTMVILMALSVIFRVIGCWGLWNDSNYAITQIALPVLSAFLIIVLVWLLGRRALWLSFIPVVLGAVFFIIKSLSFENKLYMVISILFCIAVIALYFCTVFGILHTKWILVFLFAVPFIYKVFVEDIAALRNTANPVSFAAGMQEMSALCTLLGLFFLSLSMKKTVTEESPKQPMTHRPEENGVQLGTETVDTSEVTEMTNSEPDTEIALTEAQQTDQTPGESSPETGSEP